MPSAPATTPTDSWLDFDHLPDDEERFADSSSAKAKGHDYNSIYGSLMTEKRCRAKVVAGKSRHTQTPNFQATKPLSANHERFRYKRETTATRNHAGSETV